jgi:hypothetical protein
VAPRRPRHIRRLRLPSQTGGPAGPAALPPSAGWCPPPGWCRPSAIHPSRPGRWRTGRTSGGTPEPGWSPSARPRLSPRRLPEAPTAPGPTPPGRSASQAFLPPGDRASRCRGGWAVPARGRQVPMVPAAARRRPGGISLDRPAEALPVPGRPQPGPPRGSPLDPPALGPLAVGLPALGLPALGLPALDLRALDLRALDLRALDLRALDLPALGLPALVPPAPG